MPRLFTRIQELNFELSEVQVQLSVSSGTLSDDEMQGDHWACDWGAQEPHAGEEGADADVVYVGTAQVPGASLGTVAAAPENGLLAAGISSPKCDAAISAGLITPTIPLRFRHLRRRMRL